MQCTHPPTAAAAAAAAAHINDADVETGRPSLFLSMPGKREQGDGDGAREGILLTGVRVY